MALKLKANGKHRVYTDVNGDVKNKDNTRSRGADPDKSDTLTLTALDNDDDYENIVKGMSCSLVKVRPSNGDVSSVEKPKNKAKSSDDNEDGLAENLDANISLGDLPWGARWLDFVGNVSIGGLKYAVSPNASRPRQALWSVLVAVGFGFMLYQIYER